MTSYKPGTSLPERDPPLRHKLTQIDKALEKTTKDFFKAQEEIQESLSQVERQITELLRVHNNKKEYWENRCNANLDKLFQFMDAIYAEVERAEERDQKRWNQYVRQNEEKRKRDAEQIASFPAAVDVSLVKRASTICVFDTLLFSIENWSTDGQVASDVSLCSQSILFPLVYEPVMKGDEDYFLESFPTVSLEIVRRGREFVKWLRETSPTSLSDRDTWDAYADTVREWWVNDALPLIYGARSDDWEVSAAYDYDQMVKWRDLPASRALEFPLIFDAMELMSKQMDNVRTQVGLADFTKKQTETRLQS